MTNEKNWVALALRIIGILIIFTGAITGSHFATSYKYPSLYELQGIISLGIFISGVLWGIVFLSFSKVIMLLQGIYNATPIKTNNTTVKKTAQVKQPIVTDDARNEITDFYASKGLTVQNIKASQKEDFYFVAVDGREEIVELGGFKPIIVKKDGTH